MNILNHKYHDEDIKSIAVDGEHVVCYLDQDHDEHIPFIEFNKDDAIALAKHFELTESDLA